MAIKQEIIELRDQELNDIKNSKYLSAEQRRKYIEMVTRAAEGTNGLTEKDKIQNISEITFGLATTMPRIAHYLNRNNVLTDELHQKVGELETNISSQNVTITKKIDELTTITQGKPKHNIENLDWKDTLKLVLVKPWIWIWASVLSFSPKGLEILQMLLDHFGK